MAESVLGLVTLILTGGLWLLKRWAEQKDASAPQRREEAIDRAFQNADPTVRAGELQSLDDRLRRAELEAATRQPHSDS